MKVHKEWIGSKEPATKGDLADLQEDIHVDLQQFAKKDDLDQAKKEIIYEFRAVAENIHKDVAGANKDEISWIKDKIRVIQHHVGL